MDSNELSLIAVIISLISVVIALWIAWTNHRALNFTRFDRETELRRQHAKACSELMEEIQATEKEFASELRELEYLEPEFEILLAKKPNDLSQFVPIFKSYKPDLEGFAIQARALWLETFAWYENNAYQGLAAFEAHFRRLLSDDKKVQNDWSPRIRELRTVMNSISSNHENRKAN